jgi:hypothetical protein
MARNAALMTDPNEAASVPEREPQGLPRALAST